MLKKRLPENINWEKYVLRLFSAWCLTAVFFNVSGNGTLALDFAAGTSIFSFLLVFALNFLAASLIGFIAAKKSPRGDLAVLTVGFSLYALLTIFQAESWYYGLCLAALAALLAFYALQRGALTLKKPVSSLKKWGVIAVMFAVFVALVGGTAVARLKSYTSPNYDFGIFCQMFYNMRKTLQPLTTSERDVLLSHFAIHISPIFYVLLPLYALFPSPVTLELVQPLILGSAVLPALLLAKHYRLSNARSLLVCFITLFHPAVVSGTNYDLHENCFLFPLLLWVFYFFETQRWWRLSVFTLLTLAVKEDAAIYIVFFALYVFLSRGKPRTAAALACGALAYFLAALFLLTKYGSGVMSNRYENYLPLGGSLADVVKNVLIDPGYVFTQLFIDKDGAYAAKLLFLLQLLAPLGFLPFAAKKVSRLVLLLPMVLVNLMPVYPYQYDIGFQYHFGVTAFLVYLSLLNLADLPKPTAKKFLAAAAAATAVLFAVAAFPRSLHYFSKYNANHDDYAVMNEALDAIPEDASIICSTYLLPRLCQRDEIYEDWYHQTGETEDADYVILDMRYNYDEYREKYKELGYTDIRIVSNGNAQLLCVMQKPE
ncbi:MAG: DUF2079 domain-containing protein [Clostridia bacterium]|nr:DUF2079 domain-containing protein [Clostridia bacterium]